MHARPHCTRGWAQPAISLHPWVAVPPRRYCAPPGPFPASRSHRCDERMPGLSPLPELRAVAQRTPQCCHPITPGCPLPLGWLHLPPRPSLSAGFTWMGRFICNTQPAAGGQHPDGRHAWGRVGSGDGFPPAPQGWVRFGVVRCPEPPDTDTWWPPGAHHPAAGLYGCGCDTCLARRCAHTRV